MDSMGNLQNLFQLGQHDNAEAVLNRGLARALSAGDKQTEKEVRVFLRKIEKEKNSG